MYRMHLFIKKGGWLLLPGLFGFMFFYVIPFLYSFYYAMISSPLNHTFVYFQNFINTIHSKYFRIAFGNTLLFSVISVPITVVTSYLLALLQFQWSNRYRILRFAFVLPVLLPVASVAMVFKSMINTNSMVSLYLYFIWKNCGLNMIVLTGALLSIPKELYESYALEGKNKLHRFCYITLPQTFPALLFVIIWTLSNSFQVFKELYLWYGAYPEENQYMLQHYMNNHFNKMDYQILSSSAIIFFGLLYIIISILYGAERRYGRNLWN